MRHLWTLPNISRDPQISERLGEYCREPMLQTRDAGERLQNCAFRLFANAIAFSGRARERFMRACASSEVAAFLNLRPRYDIAPTETIAGGRKEAAIPFQCAGGLVRARWNKLPV